MLFWSYWDKLVSWSQCLLRDEVGENWGHFFVAPTTFKSIVEELGALTMKAMGEVPTMCALP